MLYRLAAPGPETTGCRSLAPVALEIFCSRLSLQSPFLRHFPRRSSSNEESSLENNQPFAKSDRVGHNPRAGQAAERKDTDYVAQSNLWGEHKRRYASVGQVAAPEHLPDPEHQE